MHETCNHWSSNRAAMLFHTVLLVVAVGFKCTDAQLEICFLPLHSGDCGYPLTRYYFNVAAGRCGQFIYWYCGGNENNFATREECEAVCMPDLELTEGPATMATTATEGGVVDDAVDLNKVTSSGPLSTVIPTPTPVVMATESPTPHPSVLTTPRPVPDICLLPRVNFLCQFMQIEPRYYYNSELDECKEFSYFGCPSNENNFHTLEECLNTCVLANIPTPVNSQSPPIYIATTTTLVVSMATTSHRMSVSMATRKTMTSSIIHSSPTTSRQLLMSTTQQVPMATGSIRTSDWWTPPTSTTTEPTVNMETDPPTSELSPPPGTTEMDQSTSPPGTTDYETGTDHGQPTPNGLTPFHHASIGVGVVVVVLLLILVAIVCVIVYRHRQREKEHRQISYHVKQTVCNYPSLDTKPNIHHYGNSTISEIFV